MSGKLGKRAIHTAQISMRSLAFILDGVPAAPVVSGLDQYGVSDVLDLGAGNYTIIFAKPFERDCQPSGHCMFTADGTLEIVSVAYDRVTVQTKVSGAAADTKFSLFILGSDARFDV